MRTAAACLGSLLLICVGGLTAADSAVGQEAGGQESGELYQATVDKAVQYLRTAQTPEGAYTPQAGPAVTALVATGLLKVGLSADDPLLAKSLKYIEGFAREDGGVYSDGSPYQNYETCIVIQCLAEANGDGRYQNLLKKAEGYVRQNQWDEGEELDRSDIRYGGAGYGGKKRADLSNTIYLLDALESCKVAGDDEAVQKALIFVSRCQNLESEHNTTPSAAKINDGGFYYTPDAGGNSQAGDQGGLRSYGSMTYAGLKSMIFAGLTPDDPRVKAAVTWIQKNYDLDSNPGMGAAGLYYYYHTFAKALAAIGQETLTDASGKEHNWRQELIEELASRQQANGSWSNSEPRWMEGDPNLATGFALMALSYCKPQAK